MEKPKLKLVGEDGNAFSILGRARQSWKRAKLDNNKWNEIQKEAMSGDYDNLLRTMMEYFDICEEDDE